MAANIERALVNARQLVTPSSRYVDRPIVYYGDLKRLTFETYLRKSYTVQGNEKVLMITKGIEYRPDLVSHEFYGFPDMWWKILEVNGIKDIFDFQAGKTIFLPNLTG